MNYYISDLHLGHYGIMKHSNRPFSSVEEMDETIINNWNSVVKDEDDVYIGGDFCYKSGKNPIEYLKRLKGRKHLCVGNHDNKLLKDSNFRKYFVEIKPMMTIRDGNKTIVLCHYPMVEWDGFFRGYLHLYGHIHNNINDTYKIISNIPNAYNMGIDILGFYPRTLNETIRLNQEFNKKHKLS